MTSAAAPRTGGAVDDLEPGGPTPAGGVDQDQEGSGWGAPHWGQNFAPSPTGCPHCPHAATAAVYPDPA